MYANRQETPQANDGFISNSCISTNNNVFLSSFNIPTLQTSSTLPTALTLPSLDISESNLYAIPFGAATQSKATAPTIFNNEFSYHRQSQVKCSSNSSTCISPSTKPNHQPLTAAITASMNSSKSSHEKRSPSISV